MPFGDRTGPRGGGPLTGRGMGYCSGFSLPGFMNPGGWGSYGPGAGRGWRHWFRATGLTGWQRAAMGRPWCGWWAMAPTREEELEALREQAGFLERALENIRKRIEELSREPKTD